MSLKGGLSNTELRNAIVNNDLYKYVENGRISIEKYNELVERYGDVIATHAQKAQPKKKTSPLLLLGIAILIICGICIINALAHPGRTDSNGGHRDNNNESSLGGYHYHCGGYPAHLHTNGLCPYDTTTSYKSPSNGSNDGYSKEHGDEYDQVYEDGYDQGYAKGHEEGFSKGQKEGKDKAYDEGYKKGYEDSTSNHRKSLWIVIPLVIIGIWCIYKAFSNKKSKSD